MRYVKPKKRFGQHYLNDTGVLMDIVDIFQEHHQAERVLEIGPGMGALTQFLWKEYEDTMDLVELDRRCVAYLGEHFPGMAPRIIQADILKLDLNEILKGSTSVIGNFPYNISSQIVFKMLEHSDKIPLVVGMFQKEVALRLASGPGNRVYGVISVLAGLHYDMKIELEIPPEKFVPPPKVFSSVLVMRAHGKHQDVDEAVFRKLVKAAFSTRRKKLRNALAGVLNGRELPAGFADKRAEALSLEDYIELTNWYKSAS